MQLAALRTEVRFERFVMCQFCDDIRTEVDGKVSLMGIYTGGMQVNAKLPVTLPKLCVFSHLGSPSDDQFKFLKLEILFEDQILFSSEVPETVLAEQNKHFSESERGHMMQFAVQISPFVISHPGYVKVQVTTETGSFIANRLQVTAPLG